MDKLSVKEYEDPFKGQPVIQTPIKGRATSQGHSGLNEVKASVFRRWPVTAPYRGEQTTRLTGGHDFCH